MLLSQYIFFYLQLCQTKESRKIRATKIFDENDWELPQQLSHRQKRQSHQGQQELSHQQLEQLSYLKQQQQLLFKHQLSIKREQLPQQLPKGRVSRQSGQKRKMKPVRKKRRLAGAKFRDTATAIKSVTVSDAAAVKSVIRDCSVTLPNIDLYDEPVKVL
jgi:hypothetical protein